jgi:hypothetical protein
MGRLVRRSELDSVKFSLFRVKCSKRECPLQDRLFEQMVWTFRLQAISHSTSPYPLAHLPYSTSYYYNTLTISLLFFTLLEYSRTVHFTISIFLPGLVPMLIWSVLNWVSLAPPRNDGAQVTNREGNWEINGFQHLHH